jgi:hypothetical protein
VVPKTEIENVYLNSLASSADFDFWSTINKVGNPVTVMASPKVQRMFEDYLKTNNLEYNVEIENVER